MRDLTEELKRAIKHFEISYQRKFNSQFDWISVPATHDWTIDLIPGTELWDLQPIRFTVDTTQQADFEIVSGIGKDYPFPFIPIDVVPFSSVKRRIKI